MKLIISVFLLLLISENILAQKVLVNYVCLETQSAYWDKEKKDWVTVGKLHGAGMVIVSIIQYKEGGCFMMNDHRFNLIRKIYSEETKEIKSYAWVVNRVEDNQEMQILLKIHNNSKLREMWLSIKNYSQTYYSMEEDFFGKPPK